MEQKIIDLMQKAGCAGCAFFGEGKRASHEVGTPAKKVNECRRYPPKEDEYHHGFPIIIKGNWCGEFVPDLKNCAAN